MGLLVWCCCARGQGVAVRKGEEQARLLDGSGAMEDDAMAQGAREKEIRLVMAGVGWGEARTDFDGGRRTLAER